MRRMVFVAPGRLEWEDAPSPVLETGVDAIVRPLVMGRCDLDSLYLAGKMPLAAGEPIGHELIAEIVELGERVGPGLRVGDRVMVSAQICCGVCLSCRAGQTGRCRAVPLGASFGMGRAGGFGGVVAERVRLPFARAMTTRLPDAADPVAMIGLADMAGDAWRAVGPPLAEKPEARVLVLGAAVPVIGLFAAGLAVSLDAAQVVYVDPDPERRAIAARFGAEARAVFEAAETEPVFDVVVDAGMDAERLGVALRATAPGGRLTSVAPPVESPPLPLLALYGKGIDWQIGRPNCAASAGPTLQAWACHGFRPETVGPKVFPFEAATEAWLDPAPYVAVERPPS